MADMIKLRCSERCDYIPRLIGERIVTDHDDGDRLSDASRHTEPVRIYEHISENLLFCLQTLCHDVIGWVHLRPDTTSELQ